MSLHYGYSGGGGTCGCCCSYSAESYNTALSYGYSHYDWATVAQVVRMVILPT